MSDDAWEIAPPAFKADAALQSMKRFVRDQRVLSERNDGWLLGAELVLKLSLDGVALKAELAKRPARSPEWDRFTVDSHPALRKLQDELKRRLLRWKGDQ